MTNDPIPVPNTEIVTPTDDKIIASLFDFGFTKFASIRLIRILYGLGTAAISLMWLGVFFGGIAQDNGALRGLAVFGSPLGWLVSLMILRINLERMLILFRIEQNTRPRP